MYASGGARVGVYACGYPSFFTICATNRCTHASRTIAEQILDWLQRSELLLKADEIEFGHERIGTGSSAQVWLEFGHERIGTGFSAQV